MTLGASGKEQDDICQDKIDFAQTNFKYADNAANGFALVHITPTEMSVSYKGIDFTED
jgi:hypothetical protein